MDNYESMVTAIVNALTGSTASGNSIPVGISNRHIHLSQKDLDVLFGNGYKLNIMKDLSQPGQYACKETVNICGPRGAIEKVRILGPVRPKTQLEILSGDCFKLGVKAPVKQSGEIEDAAGGITLVGPKGSVQMTEGVMIAHRHIHMTPADATRLGVHDGKVVNIQLTGTRGGILQNTIVRTNDQFQLECHLDVEEANAMGVTNSSHVVIVE